jgi:hypothetical protein
VRDDAHFNEAEFLKSERSRADIPPTRASAPEEARRTLNALQYAQIAAYRVSLLLLALLVAARAAHEVRGAAYAWPLAALFALSAAALLIWPIIVPGRNRTLVGYSLASAFFLGGMFLLPPAALVVAVTFAVTLAGVLRGARAYRTVFHLSAAVLAYVAPALLFHLGPRHSEITFHPAARAGLEVMIATFAVTLHLLMRSVSVRLEQGRETPRWGAFSGPALVEGVWGLVLSVTILVLARIHLGFLAVVYLEIGITWWFAYRYRLYVTDLRRDAQQAAAKPSYEGAFNWDAVEEPPVRWEGGKVRTTRRRVGTGPLTTGRGATPP